MLRFNSLVARLQMSWKIGSDVAFSGFLPFAAMAFSAGTLGFTSFSPSSIKAGFFMGHQRSVIGRCCEGLPQLQRSRGPSLSFSSLALGSSTSTETPQHC